MQPYTNRCTCLVPKRPSLFEVPYWLIDIGVQAKQAVISAFYLFLVQHCVHHSHRCNLLPQLPWLTIIIRHPPPSWPWLIGSAVPVMVFQVPAAVSSTRPWPMSSTHLTNTLSTIPQSTPTAYNSSTASVPGTSKHRLVGIKELAVVWWSVDVKGMVRAISLFCHASWRLAYESHVKPNGVKMTLSGSGILNKSSCVQHWR